MKIIIMDGNLEDVTPLANDEYHLPTVQVNYKYHTNTAIPFAVDIKPEDVAIILHTSGTKKTPKVTNITKRMDATQYQYPSDFPSLFSSNICIFSMSL